MYNSVGNKIINTIEINKNINSYELNLEKVNSGLYFISIETNEGKQTIKILKTNH